MLAANDVIPIDHQSHLHLAPYAGMLLQGKAKPFREVLERLAQIFSQTWSRIPLEDRQQMQNHWNLHQSRERAFKRYAELGYSEGHCPFIAVVDLIPDPSELGRYRGYCDDDGHILLFATVWVTDASELCIAGIIAHELAHVFRIANGRESELDVACDVEKAQVLGGSCEESKEIQRKYQAQNEDETESIVKRWGIRRAAI
jgi:hypothetical protein